MILSIINLLIYDFIKIEVKNICLVKFVLGYSAQPIAPVCSTRYLINHQNFKMKLLNSSHGVPV